MGVVDAVVNEVRLCGFAIRFYRCFDRLFSF
jgi:hypothetical protein